MQSSEQMRYAPKHITYNVLTSHFNQSGKRFTNSLQVASLSSIVNLRAFLSIIPLLNNRANAQRTRWHDSALCSRVRPCFEAFHMIPMPAFGKFVQPVSVCPVLQANGAYRVHILFQLMWFPPLDSH